MGIRRRQRARVFWLATGVVAGTALGWLTAPRRGDWTRNQLRQKLLHWRRLGATILYKRSRDLENRAAGVVAGARRRWRGAGHYVDANTLVDQVHSHLGRGFGPTLAHVNLNALGHTLYLHGYVESEEDRDRLVQAVREVPGVGDVDFSHLRLLVPFAVPRPAAQTSAPPAAAAAAKPRAPRASRRRRAS